MHGRHLGIESFEGGLGGTDNLRVIIEEEADQRQDEGGFMATVCMAAVNFPIRPKTADEAVTTSFSAACASGESWEKRTASRFEGC